MRFSINWLQDFLATELSTDALVALLIQLGHEVDAVEDQAAQFNNVVVGHVLERVQHPDADRLGICTVDVGEDAPRQIICGAPNVRAGLTVATALPGAVLPGDFKIQKSKIRGVASDGMICSERELGLGDEHDGIWEMESTAKPGTPLAEAMQWNDVVLEVAVTPNRGDCLSVYGLARDLAAAGAGTLKELPKLEVGAGEPTLKAKIETAKVPAFTCIQLQGLTNGASPAWLQQRLTQAGQRPRNLLVDVTNYIMLTYGQPLHAYDAAKLTGPIVAADAQGGESYLGIGDRKVTANAGDVLILDGDQMIGLGGILGGESTAVQEDTTNVFLEAAWFEADQIARTGQDHQLQTDARYRFERGIDPAMTAVAIQAAASLMQEYGGGEMSALKVVGDLTKGTARIAFDPTLVKNFGGLVLKNSEIEAVLQGLGFAVDTTQTPWQVDAPTWRTFMTTPEDLVEEILRVKGYETVPAVLPETATKVLRGQAPAMLLARQTQRLLASQGFLETLTYSFIAADQAEQFGIGQDLVSLTNPLDEATMAVMRPSLLPGLLVAAGKNDARSLAVAKLAEVGRVFTQAGETLWAAGLMRQEEERHWQGAAPAPDVFVAKGMAEQILASAGVNLENVQTKAGGVETYHPGRCGQLTLGPKVLARFGEVHPAVLKAFDLPAGMVAFEVNIDAISGMQKKPKNFVVSTYQPVAKDLAFLLDADVAAGDVLQTVRKAVKDLATMVQIFDVYQGDKLPAGKKSLGITMTLQAMDRTLSDADIQGAMTAASQAVSKHYNGQLRDA